MSKLIDKRNQLNFQAQFPVAIVDLVVQVVGCRLKANCPLMGSGSIGGVLSVGGSF